VKTRTCLSLVTLLLTTPAAAQYDSLRTPKPEAAAPIAADKLSKAPKLSKSVDAVYPKDAQAQGVEADVVLLLSLTERGTVESVTVSEPSSSPGMGFEEAATVAAYGLEFEPAEMDGKPLAVQLAYKVRFRLAKKAAPMNEAAIEPTIPAAAPAPVAPTAPAHVPVANYTGTLLERGTRLPLSGVLVTVFRDGEDGKPVGFETTSDAQGAFRFFDLAPGAWRFHLELPGYFPYRTTEEIKAGEVLAVKYFVEKGSYNPFDVTVVAARPRKEVSRTVVTAQEIEHVPGTFGDPLNVLQNFAGVARTGGLLGGLLVVRGSLPQDTRFAVDGTDVPIVYHFGNLRSVLPLGMIDSLEFYPGNFSPYYGRAIGGAVDIQVKKLQPKKIGGYADISVFDGSLYLEAPLGSKAAIAIAGRRSYIDAFITAFTPKDAPVSFAQAPRYYDFQLLASYRPRPEHDLRAFVFGSDDRMKLLFKDPGQLFGPAVNGNDFRTSTSFYRTLLTYKYVPGERIENTFRLAQGRNWSEQKVAQYLANFTFDFVQLRETVRAKLTDTITIQTGLDVQYVRADAHVNLPRPLQEGEVMSDYDLSNTIEVKLKGLTEWYPAGFFELELKPLPGLLLLPGVRFDRFSAVGQNVWQPRLTARWEVRKDVTVKGGVGLFAQEPQLYETDPTFGNPTLHAQKATHYSAGVEYKPCSWLGLDATGFYRDLSNLVSSTDATIQKDGVQKAVVYDNQGGGRAYGLELVARHEFAHNFTGWLAYTLSRSERRDSGKTDYRLLDFDQTHILTALGSYVLPRHWMVSGRFRLVSGLPYTPVKGAAYDAYDDQYKPSYGQVNSARMGMFAQLDVRLDKSWTYKTWILGMYLDTQNLFNRTNPSQYNYSFNYRQTTVQPVLPVMAILGVKAEF
jgi:TonB family protein